MSWGQRPSWKPRHPGIQEVVGWGEGACTDCPQSSLCSWGHQCHRPYGGAVAAYSPHPLVPWTLGRGSVPSAAIQGCAGGGGAVGSQLGPPGPFQSRQAFPFAEHSRKLHFRN